MGKAIRANDDDDDDNGPGTYHEILMNSKPFIITENLCDGLSELRKDVTGYLWIDALCIDQTNMNERASQVLLMGDIYSSATCVIIWLGKAIDEIEDVIWLLERYLPVAEKGRPAKEVNYDLLTFLGITPGRWLDLWLAYGRFFSRYSWFSRAWVVQELLLARDIIIRCGQKTLDWKGLQRLTAQGIKCGIDFCIQCRRFMGFSIVRTSLANGVPSEGFAKSVSFSAGAKTAEEQ